MEKTHLFRQELELVQSLVNKLECGELTIDELEQITIACSNLYERAIILKYKAFEQKVRTTEQLPEPYAIPVIENDPEIEETLSIEVIDDAEDEMPAFDFDILEDEQDAHEPSIIEEVISSEATQHEPLMEEKVTPAASTGALFTDNSLASKLAGGKLSSLVGAFGLNERLRFINNLFDGSSEAFSAAVKELDAQNGGEAAMQRVQSFAAQYNWDQEDESVTEFVTYIQRRYA